MPNSEKRQQPRIEVRLPVNYICTDGEGTELSAGMGRTKNISKGGIYLETPTQIDSEFIILMTIDINDKLVQVRGKVAHCQVSEGGLYETGIKFVGTPEDILNSVKMLVKTYHAHKNA